MLLSPLPRSSFAIPGRVSPESSAIAVRERRNSSRKRRAIAGAAAAAG